MSNKESSTFCIMPFIHISAKTSGALRLCCESPDSDVKPREVLGLRENQIQDVWNNSFYQDVRKKMLSDTPLSSCEVCYKKERKGVTSRRMEYNQAWEERLGTKDYQALIHEANDNSGCLQSTPRYLDLRLGSLCNLKCRMCNSLTSTSFAKEWEDLQEYTGPVSPEYFPQEQNFLKYSKKLSPWYESPSFWQELESLAPKLKRIYLTGGEPLLIKNNLKLLKKLLESGNNQVEITINTNLTQLSEEFLETFEQFEHSTLSLSIDGVGKTNNYIRYPSRWEDLETNLLRVAKRRIRLDLTFTLQAYNFFTLIPFLEWLNHNLMEKLDYIDWNILEGPHYLSYIILDYSKRLEYVEELKRYLDSSETALNKKIYNKLRDKFPLFVTRMAITHEDKLHKQNQKLFLRYTALLDQHRKQKLWEEIPQLSYLQDELAALAQQQDQRNES